MDAARAAAAADPAADGLADLAQRCRPALDLLAPPGDPPQVAAVATRLAHAHFAEDVLPALRKGEEPTGGLGA